MSFTKRLFYCVIMEVEKEREYMNQIKIAKKLLKDGMKPKKVSEIT